MYIQWWLQMSTAASLKCSLCLLFKPHNATHISLSIPIVSSTTTPIISDKTRDKGQKRKSERREV